MYWQLSFSERENCNILPTLLIEILCSREWSSSSGSRISQTFNRWLSKKKKEKRFLVNISCYGPFEAGQEWLGAFCTCPSVHVEKRCPIKPLYKCLSLTTTYWKEKHLFFIRVDVCVCVCSGFSGARSLRINTLHWLFLWMDKLGVVGWVKCMWFSIDLYVRGYFWKSKN